MLRRIALVALLAIAALARAGEEPDWKSIIVRFDIDRDGKLHVTEQATVSVPPSVQRLERTYWTDAEQSVTFDAITLYDGDRTVELEDNGDLDRAHHFRQSDVPGKVVWSVRDTPDVPAQTRELTYVLRSRVSDGVIPAWSIPRGELSHDPNGRIDDPRIRLRQVIPLWREAMKNPLHRFLADYQFDMPPPSTEGTSIQLQIYWPAGWKPVHEITPDTVARPLERDFSNPDRWRITHLFEEDSGRLLTGIDIPRHALRMGALLGFPVAGLLLWTGFVLLELVRRPRGEDGEQLVREVIYKQPPEQLEARWTGRAPFISTELFVARLERERKVSVSEDGTVRLLVSRDQLPPYDALGIQFLLRDAWETTAAEIAARNQEEGFDTGNALHLALQKSADEAKRKERAPLLSRLTSIALFATGIVIAFQETVRMHREPAGFAATIIVSAMLFNIWPGSWVRDGVRSSLRHALWLLLPLAIFTAVLVAAHFVAQQPPTYFLSIGMAVAFLGTYKGILAGSASRGDAQLILARNWLRNELRSPMPRVRDDAIPWLNALGLQRDVEQWKRRRQLPA